MLAHKANKSNAKKIKSIIDDNIECINNWDLTDTLVPKAIGKQLIDESDEKIYKTLRHYTKNKDIWIRRIGIVSLMYLAKAARKEVVLKVIDDNFFDTFHLTQKANGWMLRELYKTCPKDTLEYLKQKNKLNKLPSILKSYATEKMTQAEKQELK
jgi:3-methyladenine DNA glycosylase AlkD